MARLRLQSLIERLDALRPDEITVSRVQQMLADGELDDAEMKRFIGVLPDKYARRPVHRSRYFDILVLTWAPGQGTPIHNHAGNCGWVRLVRGQIAEETFQLVPGASLADAAVAANCQGRTGNIGLQPTGSGVIATVGAVATVDRSRAIHRLGNPAQPGGDFTATLHVYSLPHDRCLAFDLASRTCEPRQMVFDPLPIG